MQIAQDKVVTLVYVLKNEDGEVLEAAEAGDEFVYLHGHDNIVPGLEEALTGKSAGDSLKVVVPADQGFGEYDEDMVQEVPREEFSGIDEIEVGMQFEAETDDGPQLVTVVEIADDVITVDGNHELAGLDLHYEVQVVDVRDATEEELAHGHAHGAGCEDEDWDDADDDWDDDDDDEADDEVEENLN